MGKWAKMKTSGVWQGTLGTSPHIFAVRLESLSVLKISCEKFGRRGEKEGKKERKKQRKKEGKREKKKENQSKKKKRMNK